MARSGCMYGRTVQAAVDMFEGCSISFVGPHSCTHNIIWCRICCVALNINCSNNTQLIQQPFRVENAIAAWAVTKELCAKSGNPSATSTCSPPRRSWTRKGNWTTSPTPKCSHKSEHQAEAVPHTVSWQILTQPLAVS